MVVMHVFIQVKPEYIEAFKAATVENGRNSVQEPGIARFDGIHHVGPRELNRRNQPEQDGRHRRRQHGEPEHACIEPYAAQALRGREDTL